MTPTDLRTQLAKLERQLDSLSADNLKKDYQVAALRQELRQRQQALILLSELQRNMRGLRGDLRGLLAAALPAIDARVGMARSIALTPLPGQPERYRPVDWTGDWATANIAEMVIEVPRELAIGDRAVLVNQSSEPDALAQRLREAFALRYFVCVGISDGERPLGLILAGRDRESFFPGLNHGDVDTLRAVAGLIAALA